MSDTSKRLASQFAAYQKQNTVQAEVNLQEKKVLDEGFKRLREELEQSLTTLCDDLNQEPGIGNILSCNTTDKKFDVKRGDSGVILSVKFDEVLHKVSFVCDAPSKFRYQVEVKPHHNGRDWWFSDSETGGKVPLMAEKAVKALLGIPF